MDRELAPTPKLRDVTKLIKSSKDVNFLRFFDSNSSNLYLTVRHRYNQLVEISANGISHLKLFTKFLHKTIEAQQASSDTCLHIIEQYREEEPTLNTSGFAKISDETSVALPPHLTDQKSGDITDFHKKTDFDAFTDILSFERNMGQLLVMYWQKLTSEVYTPLYEFRKAVITKLESIQEHVSLKYDKLMRNALKLRESKVSAIQHWNDLCDARHTLRKARASAPDSNKTKKQASKVKTVENKARRQFEHVVELVDKFNNIQDEFWNEIVKDACLQLEAMEYSRICFYQQYFDKYRELLKWRRAELENGEKTLERAGKMMMTPFEIAEYGIHPIRVDHGTYNGIPPQQYELPCMPQEVLVLTGKITEQRIDPGILNPVFNPFGEELKPSTSRHIKTNYSRASSVNIFSMGLHDRNVSTSSSVSSISAYQVPTAYPITANSIINQQPQHTFFADNTKSMLFGRTNRAQTHGIGLPKRPFNDSDEDDGTVDMTSPVSMSRSPPKSPPSIGKAFNQNKPQLPPRPPPKPIGRMNSNNSDGRPSVPRRTKRKKSSAAPPLPPRRKTAPISPNAKSVPKLPRKSPAKVAEIVRKNTLAIEEKHKKVSRKTGK